MLLNMFLLLRGIFLTGSYSNQIFPDPLTKEEEDICIKKAKLGDKDARNKLIEHNLRLVAHIVKKFESRYIEQDDLISIGTIGLIKGVDTFSNDKGVRITTYCARCIRKFITIINGLLFHIFKTFFSIRYKIIIFLIFLAKINIII